jgi:hypothetical protein
MTTEPDKYKPTKAETALLLVMLNPENATLSITDICNLAGVNRSSYYDAFAKEKFVGYYKSKAKDLISHAIGPVVNSFVKEAKKGSYQHGKTLLEMAGLHTDKLDLSMGLTVIRRKKRFDGK